MLGLYADIVTVPAIFPYIEICTILWNPRQFIRLSPNCGTVPGYDTTCQTTTNPVCDAILMTLRNALNMHKRNDFTIMSRSTGNMAFKYV